MRAGSSLNDVFNDKEFHSVIETAARLKDREKSIETLFILVFQGILGGRLGETIHLTPDWIDTQTKVIIIPDHFPCPDCTYCDELARKRLKNSDGERTLSEVREEYWQPKSARGARTIHYGEFPDLVVEVIETYKKHLEETRTELKQSTTRNRIRLAAEITKGIDRERMKPQVLRATAASRLARMGMPIVGLQRMFGWRYPHTAAYYLWMSGQNIKKELRQIFRQPTSADRYIQLLRFMPPTPEEWRSQFGLVSPPEGYTPSSLNEEGQLGRDDEEMLIQQGQLSQFTEEYIGPLAAQTEDSDIDDIEDLDEIEDTNQLMRATLPGVLLFAEVSGRVSNENWEELLGGDPKAGDTTRPRLSRYLRPIREAVAGLRHESKQRMAIGQNTIAPIDTRAAANCIGFVSFLVMGLAYSIVSMSLVGFSQRSISVAGAVGLLIGFFHLFRARYNERAHSGTS